MQNTARVNTTHCPCKTRKQYKGSERVNGTRIPVPLHKRFERVQHVNGTRMAQGFLLFPDSSSAPPNHIIAELETRRQSYCPKAKGGRYIAPWASSIRPPISDGYRAVLDRLIKTSKKVPEPALTRRGRSGSVAKK